MGLFKQVDCIRVIAMARTDASRMLELLRAEITTFDDGMPNRTVVQLEERDPDGGAAGCFRAHVRAWRAAASSSCRHTLMLEEDAFFHRPALCAEHADKFLSSGVRFDLLYLGWRDDAAILSGPRFSRAGVPRDVDCIVNLKRILTTHAYT